MSTSRFPVGAAIPWLLAASSFAFGSIVWLRSPGVEKVATSTPAATHDPKSLALETARAENQVLRRELDRLSALVRRGGGQAGSQATQIAAGDSARGSDGALQDLAKLLKEQLELSAAGDPHAKAEVAQAVFDMLRSGPAAFSALRDVYLSTADPHN